MKLKKIVILFLGAALLITGCSSQNKSFSENQMVTEPAKSDEKPYEISNDAAESEVAPEEVLTGSSGQGLQTSVQTNSQKLIKEVYLKVESKSFDELVEDLSKKIEELGGYIENSEITGNSYEYENNRYADLKIRIPNDKLSQFVSVVGDKANIINKTENTTDVTLEYVDMESHVNALRAEQESLLNILEAATKLDDIIKIQSQLTQVRYEIESYESQLRTYDNLVSYSTVNLVISEVSRETKTETKNFGETMKSRLSDNLYDIGQGFQSFVIWFVSSVPYFIIWGIILVPCIIILRKILKKYRNK